MEATILKAFDKLSSTEPEVIYLGVQEIDSLICQICNLDVPSSKQSTKRNKQFTSQLNTSQVKQFIKLQDSFMFNIASRLATCYSKLSGEQLVLSLNTIEGLCLLHHPSRRVFESDVVMKQLISTLDTSQTSQVQVAVINTLVSIMVRQVDNFRKFEQLDGLKQVSTLFKSKDTPKDVKVEILEFLFFYLIPETKQKAPKPGRKTTDEKSKLLGKYLSNVAGLVRELNTSTPFCDMDLEW